MPKKTEASTKPEILTFRDGQSWIAAWRRRDLMAQGPTERVAMERLFNTLLAQLTLDHEDGRAPFEGVNHVPAKLLTQWEKRHAECHPKNEPTLADAWEEGAKTTLLMFDHTKRDEASILIVNPHKKK
jgi:hypothetical protein